MTDGGPSSRQPFARTASSPPQARSGDSGRPHTGPIASSSGSGSRSSLRSLSLSAKARGKTPAFAGTIAYLNASEDTKLDRIRRLHLGGLLRSPSSLASPTSLPLHSPTSYSPTSPSSIGLSTSPIRRSASEDDTSSGHAPANEIPPHPPPKLQIDPAQAALLQSARLKLSSRDQEAMRKMRSTMMEFPNSASSTKSDSPLSPKFLTDPTALREVRTRSSTLSNVVQRRDSVDGSWRSSGATPVSGPSTRPQRTTNPPLSKVDFVIAVVGYAGVGKSTFISRSLRSWGVAEAVHVTGDDDVGYTAYESQIEPDGGQLRYPWRFALLEIDFASLNLSDPSSPLWPSGLPAAHGAVFCYDAKRADSLRDLGTALQRLSKLSVPMIMLACKSDPDDSLEVEATDGNALGEPYNVGLIEVTATSPEGRSKMKAGLKWLLYKLEQRQRRQQRKVASALSVQTADVATPPSAPIALDSLSPDSDSSPGIERIKYGDMSMTTATDCATTSAAEQPPGEPRHHAEQPDVPGDAKPSSSSLSWMMRGPLNLVSEGREVELEDEASSRAERTEAASSGPPSETTTATMASRERANSDAVEGVSPTYLSLGELFTRLFGSIVSTENEAFVRAFFLTYRRFCLPIDLMREFLERFKQVETYAILKDIKHWALMKLTGALIDWTAQYPGDLGDESTQAVFRELLASNLRHTFIAHLSAELVLVEQNLYDVFDEDRSWTYRPSVHPLTLQTSIPSLPSGDLEIDTGMLYDLDSSGKSASMRSDSERQKGSTPSDKSVSTSSLAFDAEVVTPALQRRRSGSDTRMLSGAGGAVVDDKRDDLGFGRWAQAFSFVLNGDPWAFAVELTKMQWELFSAVRPRDVFRHTLGKEREGPVERAITFFNYLSSWTSTIILANPKPKHRAKIYERFMLIAHQLRRLKNYDSLYAILEGMRETSVKRLTQTHYLVQVPAAVEKEYLSHVKLMDPRGGYQTYRAALRADLGHGNVAIPLLTQVLGMVNRLQIVRSEDVRADGMIQWEKFAKFGEYVAVMTECQARGPIVLGPASKAFRNVIEDTPVYTDEDDLFERSQMLEPPIGQGGGGGGGVLKRLAGLAL